MTDALPRPEHEGSADEAASAREQFPTAVEAKDDGHWLAVVHLGDGASVCKLFDSEAGAQHYGDELAAWLASRRSD